ncbi:MAG: hypothetical protein PF489_00705, partial [Salinivirgaceae bacterium]|nr:hypothetical protein [Salinivirgaceae bacterium]
MRPVLFVLIFFALSRFSYGQNAIDLSIIKPEINFNHPEGGYYSGYFADVEKIYCGLTFKNNGRDTATNVYMKATFLYRSGDTIAIKYSDTLAVVDTIQEYELNLVEENIGNFSGFSVVYSLLSDSAENNISDNYDTIPYSGIQYLWAEVGRTFSPTGKFNVNSIEGFQSGDFIGATFESPGNLFMPHSFSVYSYDSWPEGFQMYAKVYEDSVLVDSVRIFENNANGGHWITNYFSFSQGHWGAYNSTYTYGVQLFYNEEDSVLPIGIDTLHHHNFGAEANAIVGNTWENISFVPVIKGMFNPEGIEDIHNSSIELYPNPTNGPITISSAESVSIYQCNGTLLQKIDGN